MHSLSDVRTRLVPDRGYRVRTPRTALPAPIAMRALSVTAAPDCDGDALRAVLAALPDAVVVVDAGDTVLYATPATQRVLLRSPDELVGRPLGISILDDETSELGLIRGDGSECVIEMRVQPLTFDGRPARVVTMRDVTERSRVEETVRLETDREVRRDTCGRIARDYRDLLTTVLCGAQLIAEGADDPMALARRIIDAAESASDLTHRLLTVAGDRVRPDTTTDLDTTVAGFAERMTPLLEERITFDVHLGAPQIQVGLTTEHLEQVLGELVQNALDALPSRGTLTVRTATRDVELSAGGPAPGTYAVLSIEDTGAGMSRETRRHLFDAYYTTKDERRGRGLGLAEVFGLISPAGGFVEVESADDEGTRIDILMPIDATPAAPRPAPDGPFGAIAGRSVLLIEDEEGIRRLLAEVLQGAGAQVITAGTLEEATALLGRHAQRLDLQIADVRMPDGTGLDLVARAREGRPDIPAVLMSGFSARMPMAGVPGGPTEFLPKPFLPGALLETACRLLPGDETGKAG